MITRDPTVVTAGIPVRRRTLDFSACPTFRRICNGGADAATKFGLFAPVVGVRLDVTLDTQTWTTKILGGGWIWTKSGPVELKAQWCDLPEAFRPQAGMAILELQTSSGIQKRAGRLMDEAFDGIFRARRTLDGLPANLFAQMYLSPYACLFVCETALDLAHPGSSDPADIESYIATGLKLLVSEASSRHSALEIQERIMSMMDTFSHSAVQQNKGTTSPIPGMIRIGPPDPDGLMAAIRSPTPAAA